MDQVLYLPYIKRTKQPRSQFLWNSHSKGVRIKTLPDKAPGPYLGIQEPQELTLPSQLPCIDTLWALGLPVFSLPPLLDTTFHSLSTHLCLGAVVKGLIQRHISTNP